MRTSSHTGNSPSQVTSSHDKPSPLSAAVVEATALDKARLFLHGRFDDLAKEINDAEKAIMSTWFYQLWVFTFVTPKHCGKEPLDWTRYNLDFDVYERFRSRPSPASPAGLASSSTDVDPPLDVPSEIGMPSQLCRRSIHLDQIPYDGINGESDY
jgi:hypothetical protein